MFLRDAEGGKFFRVERSLVLGVLIVNISLYLLELQMGARSSREGWMGFLYIERAIAGFFTLEYLFRIISARSKIRYLSSPMGVIDLLSILPFWVGFWPGLSSRQLELVRLARFIRLGKLYRYDAGLQVFMDELRKLRSTAWLAFRINFIYITVLTACVFVAERDAPSGQFSTLLEAFRFVIVTLSTVGYGDQIPVTPFGQAVFYASVLGIGLLAGSVLAIMAKAFDRTAERMKEQSD